MRRLDATGTTVKLITHGVEGRGAARLLAGTRPVFRREACPLRRSVPHGVRLPRVRSSPAIGG